MSLMTVLASRAWLDRLIRRGAARVPGRVTTGASVAAISIVAAFVAWRTHPSVFEPVRSDFAMMVAAVRAWLSGVDPYTAIGPGRAYWGVVLGRNAFPRPADYVGDMATTGQWMVWLLYLPCVLMVLDRPNVAPDEAAAQTPDKTAGSDRATA